MWPNSQETADLVAFAEELLNEKLHFLCSVVSQQCYKTQHRNRIFCKEKEQAKLKYWILNPGSFIVG